MVGYHSEETKSERDEQQTSFIR